MSLEAIVALRQPVRRAVHEYVAAQAGPVSRNEVAEAVGARSSAAGTPPAGLRAFVYRTAHLEPMRRRREWFVPLDAEHLVPWRSIDARKSQSA
ncbi:DUF3291 domain-containing protein [Micromonospora sp. NPDC050980]|uniref:DUF3291 domain-containing protein n=1 Tax=Micromonospora sp. NPDC050980 TaxID=3155161 RepID=UPI0033F8AFE6